MTSLVSGYCNPRFDRVSDLFGTSLHGGTDVGASVCVTIGGEILVDLWGGWSDEAKTRPWQRDTIVNVYSTTKTMAALVILILADRREVDLDVPMVRYWPEFGVNGKSTITLSHVLSHSSGLSGWQEPMRVADLYDWDKATSLLAAQAPFWTPGSGVAYHAVTQGFLLGEVVRRVTGRTLGQFFGEEVADPLGEDFYIGFGPQLDDRVADLVPPPARKLDVDAADPLLVNARTNPVLNVLDTRTRDWRAAEIPAANGHGNARSIATIQSILANGGEARGTRFLSEEMCRRPGVMQIAGADPVIGRAMRYGLAFALSGDILRTPHDEVIFWGGGGGSLVVVDPRFRMTMAFAMNLMSPDAIGDRRSTAIVEAVWSAIEN